MPYLHDSDSGEVFMGRDVTLPMNVDGLTLDAYLSDYLHHEAQGDDWQIARYHEVYCQLHLVEGASQDTATWLAGIAAGILPPTT